MKIPYVNLAKQWDVEKTSLLPLIEKTLASGQYIGGDIVLSLEKKIAQLCGTKYCLSLNSGTDALIFGLHALGIKPGDEVITPPNSFIASTAAIAHIGAIPVFADVLPDQNIDPEKIKLAITNKTKAIMPVHLTGRMARMDEITKIASEYNLKIIEDAAQAIGSKYLGRPSGSWGDIGCFSAHPLKNLNACGDGGFLVTNSELIFEKLKHFKNHGLIDRNTSVEFGLVSRLDTIQAVILDYRLKNLDEINSIRRRNANLYRSMISDDVAFIPHDSPSEFNTFHTFVIQTKERDALQAHLMSKGIETSIHYPVPIHLQPASKKLGYKKGNFPVTEDQAKKILTLPINQHLSTDEIEYISHQLNIFFKS